MTQRWPEVALGDVCVRVGKRAPNGAGGAFTYVDLSSVDQTTKAISRPTLVAIADAPSRARQPLEAEDVLVSTVRPNLNAVAVVPEELHGATGSTGFCVLRPRRGLLDPRYLFHWVRCRRFIDEMVRLATGASYPAVTDRIVGQSRLPLAPIDEQRRIAAILDAADDIRARRIESASVLASFDAALFVDMFGHPRPDRPDGSAPRLSDVASFVRGVTFKPSEVVTEPSVGDVPVMRTSNVQWRLEVNDLKWLPASVVRRDEQYLRHGDTLISSANNWDAIGRACWVGELPWRASFGAFVTILRATSADVDPWFLCQWFRSDSVQTVLRSFGQKTTNISNLNLGRAREMPIQLPNLADQQLYRARCRAARQAGALTALHASHLDELFASLEQRAFRGEL